MAATDSEARARGALRPLRHARTRHPLCRLPCRRRAAGAAAVTLRVVAGGASSPRSQDDLRLPHLPLFVGDFLAATATWSGDERAAYLLLLAVQWSSGPLPASPREIARILGYDPRAFARLWRRIGVKFQPVPGGLANPRLEQHRAKALDIRRANHERAKAAAAARYGRGSV
jgi:uncharacterized protein YdaU (DUF1376 family)